mmetsp:Transcript_9200/g.19829  ORF Transcript_9200/g.19829 Transcript_9200/m.19829 type:complete len:1297 (+) Transcript_9200:189-4079(+)|eukprot:CAMPEP_0168722638 /NCGR_PEP_ID=MMETSP0724-20121128/2701_1 /TAXON_ID=265536 /ORGANISM="Amphiprora sp., Strain CCMP467" /LENGTH=1296 /DNA_ID=CAMNT_0008769317 /DNA_START=164 /DNA_END=4054 /DNA_ORIENTATION=+
MEVFREDDPSVASDDEYDSVSGRDEEAALPPLPQKRARRSSLALIFPQKSNKMSHSNHNNNNFDESMTLHESHHNNNLHHNDSTNNNGNHNHHNESAVKKLARLETWALWCLRAVLIVVFLGSPVVVSIGVYRYLKQEQDDEFQARFAVSADQILESLQDTVVGQWLPHADNVAWERWDLAQNNNDTTTTAAATQLPVFPFSSRPSLATVGQRWIEQLPGYQRFHESLMVTLPQRDLWQEYAVQHYNDWVADVMKLQQQQDETTESQPQNYTLSYEICYPHVPVQPRMYNDDLPYYLVSWQAYPLLPSTSLPVYNSDWLADSSDIDNEHELFFGDLAWSTVLDTKQVLFSKFYNGHDKDGPPTLSAVQMPLLDRRGSPNFQQNATALQQATLYGIHTHHVDWHELWQQALPRDAALHKLAGIQLVTSNNECGQEFTLQVPETKNDNNEEDDDDESISLTLLDTDEPVDMEYGSLTVTATLQELVTQSSLKVPSYPPMNTEYCPITFKIIPTQDTKNQYLDNKPRIFAIAAVAVYVFTSFLLIVYDLIISRRQSIVMKAAVQSTNIVSSLFPSQVRDRLFDLGGAIAGAGGAVVGGIGRGLGFRARRASTGQEGPGGPGADGMAGNLAANPMEPLAAVRQVSPPVADLYPEATVMFADIAGFTAWCSAREPSQVFVLLETLYGSFDQHANKRKVFKVETIGDSYVAVAGLPEPRKDHAVVMARFARNCLDAMNHVCNHLMVELGPDTADLALRVGLHSGAVTAGVLRGQKARFQLFGDTVNTAARMESNGLRGRIQASEATVKALEAHKKGHWATKREDLIEAKGKGKLQTYWIDPKKSSASSSRETESNSGSVVSASEMPNVEVWQQAAKMDSLVAWNVDVLSRLLQRIAATRGFVRRSSLGWTREFKSQQYERAILFERTEQINFAPTSYDMNDENSPALPYLTDEVKQQIRQFVQEVCGMYKESLPFHNFEKATHVALSLKTLVVSAQKVYNSADAREDFFASDPIAEFACFFAILIHSMDHPGVSNKQLVQQGDEKASMFHERCMNEQHAFNMGFDLLMSDSYSNLRSMIACSKAEWARFRQVVVNCVLATDTLDKDFEDERLDQWEQSFGASALGVESNTKSQTQRRATIFMEHLVQAAVAGPFMQHYQIYNKWFERRVLEVHQSALYLPPTEESVYKEDFDWYNHQLSRFDNVVIPLVTKLDASGFLGGTGREQLECAKRNRAEFAEEGEAFVKEVVARLTSSGMPTEEALQDVTILEELAKDTSPTGLIANPSGLTDELTDDAMSPSSDE